MDEANPPAGQAATEPATAFHRPAAASGPPPALPAAAPVPAPGAQDTAIHQAGAGSPADVPDTASVHVHAASLADAAGGVPLSGAVHVVQTGAGIPGGPPALQIEAAVGTLGLALVLGRLAWLAAGKRRARRTCARRQLTAVRIADAMGDRR